MVTYAILISYFKVEYFFGVLSDAQKSNFGQAVYTIYKFSKFRWTECWSWGVPRKMLVHYSARLNFEYLPISFKYSVLLIIY